MKVLLVRPGPSFSVQDVAFGWRDGLRACGAHVADFNLDDRLEFYSSQLCEFDGELRRTLSMEDAARRAATTLYEACYTYWPDIVLIVSALYIPMEVIDTIRAHGHKVVLLFTESPYEDARQYDAAPHADVVLLNDPCNLEHYRALNPRSYYIPHAYRPEVHYPGPGNPEKASDFAFIGTGFPSRIEFFEQIDFDGLDFLLGGCWTTLPDESRLLPYLGHRKEWCTDNVETAEVYRSTRSSLNLYRREIGFDGATGRGLDTMDGWSMGPREVELAATGTFFLRDPRPESDEVLPMLPTFSEPGEVRPLLDWWLAHDTEREEAALKARAAIADRTFQANAAWFLQQLGD